MSCCRAWLIFQDGGLGSLSCWVVPIHTGGHRLTNWSPGRQGAVLSIQQTEFKCLIVHGIYDLSVWIGRFTAMRIPIGGCTDPIKGWGRLLYKDLRYFLGGFEIGFVRWYEGSLSFLDVFSLRHPCYEILLETIGLVRSSLTSQTLLTQKSI